MPKLKVGLTAGLMHPDPNRNLFRPKTVMYSETQMYEWIADSDLLPILIPPQEELLDKFLSELDGVILFGGADVAPQSYGEVARNPDWHGDPIRDAYEISVIKKCIASRIPLFGICRGIQILNVALGGTLYQDINTDTESTLIHRDAELYDKNYHSIKIEPGGFMDKLYLNSEEKRINTIHHQAIKDLSPDLAVEAVSSEDGIIEAVRHRNPDVPVFAVQWHPEWLAFDQTKCLDPDRLLTFFKSLMEN